MSINQNSEMFSFCYSNMKASASRGRMHNIVDKDYFRGMKCDKEYNKSMVTR